MPNYKAMYLRLLDETGRAYNDLQIVGDVLLHLKEAQRDAEKLAAAAPRIQEIKPMAKRKAKTKQ